MDLKRAVRTLGRYESQGGFCYRLYVNVILSENWVSGSRVRFEGPLCLAC